MAFNNEDNFQYDDVYDVANYDMPYGLPVETLEDYEESDIRQRIKDAVNDDTHPSTDADMDPQEMYDLGYIV